MRNFKVDLNLGYKLKKKKMQHLKQVKTIMNTDGNE